jgi:hypothetical protein
MLLQVMGFPIIREATDTFQTSTVGFNPLSKVFFFFFFPSQVIIELISYYRQQQQSL